MANTSGENELREVGREADLVALADELGELAQIDVPLSPRCTYRVGGSAKVLVEVTSWDHIELLLSVTAKYRPKVLAVGKGSNLLVSDDGFLGLAVVLGHGFDHIEIEGDVIRAGAAAGLPVVARRSAGAGLTGFEWAVGVPGSVGGALRMNAGGHGSMISNVLFRAKVADLYLGTISEFTVDELDLSYRHSNLEAHQLVLEAEFQLRPGSAEAAEAEIHQIVKWRRENQPGGRNAGSVFTNPPGASAGALIDAAGAKGLRVGSAEVSTKHANFIQVDPNGLAADVVALMRLVRQKVYQHAGVVLEPETRLIGLELGELEIDGNAEAD
ncbi:MAG: UDP-N-acetylmuramate dehydrogenase [Acidimicrobiia bacterium]